MKNRNRSGWIAIALIAVIALAGVLVIRQRSTGTAAQAAGSKDVVEKHIQHETPTPATPIPVDLSKNSDTRYVQIDGNAVYDARVSNPKAASVPCPVVKPLNLYRRKEQVCSLLGADFISDWTTRQAEDDGASLTIKTEDGARISAGSRGSLECKTKFGHDAEILPVNVFEKIYAYPETDFSWGSRESCVQNAQSVFQKLGVDVVGSKTVAVTTAVYEKRYQENLPLWEAEKAAGIHVFVRDHIDCEDDELFYVVNLQQRLGELPVYNSAPVSGFFGASLNPTDIYAIYSRRGLEAVNGSCLYEVQAPGETRKVISFEKAVQTFSDYVNGDLQASEAMRIVYVGLEYIPDSSMYESGDLAVMRPYWIFRVEIPEANRLDAAILDYCIDAETGEVL